MKRTWRTLLAALILLGRAPAAWAEPPLVTISWPSDKRVELELDDSGAAGSVLVPAAEQPACCAAKAETEAEINAGGHFTLGAGLYALQPYFQTNPAYMRQTAPPRPNFFPPVAQTDFHYGMHGEPLIWLRYVSDCGLGARVRWWQFNVGATTAPSGPFGSSPVTSASVLGTAIGATGFRSEAIAFASDLHMNVSDYEASQDFTAGCSACTLAGGIRYAHMAQDYHAGRAAATPFGGGVLDILDLLSFSHNFNGAGPTLALECNRPLGRTGFALYGSARGSILFGSAHQRLFTGGLQENGSIGTSLRATTDAASVLPVGELEVGAEYGHCLGRLHVFAQAAFVGQVWFGAGNASNSDGVFTSGSGSNTNLGLVGLAVRAGVDF